MSALCTDVQLQGRDVQVIETCHSTWVFDPPRRRFQRIPRGLSLTSGGEWTPYHALDIDESGAFSVNLNAAGTRWLRSKVHVEPCPLCHSGTERTDTDNSPVVL